MSSENTSKVNIRLNTSILDALEQKTELDVPLLNQPSEDSSSSNLPSTVPNLPSLFQPVYGGPTQAKNTAKEALIAVSRILDPSVSEESLSAIRNYIDKSSRGAGSALPLICTGKKCVFLHVCELDKNGITLPVGAKCQPFGTRVLTSNRGYVEIQDLDQNIDKVISYYYRSSAGGSNSFKTNGRKFTLFSKYFGGNLVKVTADSYTSSYTPDHICLARWNESALDKFVVYLMRKENYFRVGVASIIKQSKNGKKKYSGIASRASTEQAEEVWILQVCSSKVEALLAEELHSVRGEIPKACFRATLGRRRTKYEGLYAWVTQAALDSHHKNCQKPLTHYADYLSSLGLDINYPIWKYKTSSSSNIKSENLGGFTFTMDVRACNLLEGIMSVPTIEPGMHYTTKAVWKPIKIGKVPYAGQVFSLDVEKDSTYVADGIPTHNCPLEMVLVSLWVNKHLKSLGIDDIDNPEYSFDMDMLYELAAQELIKYRCAAYMSKNPAVVESKMVGESFNGTPIFADVMNPVLEAMDKAGRNIAKIRDALLATRKAQVSAGQIIMDSTEKAAILRQKAKELNKLRQSKESMRDADFTVKTTDEPIQ